MRTKVSLIVQDGAMIPQTEVPPLPVDVRHLQCVMEVIPTTVRFLRSGCPAVQWVITADALFHPEEDPNQTKILDAVEDALSNLQMSGENFRIQAPTGAWKPGTVFTLSRIVAPATEEVTSADLKIGDEIVFGRRRCMVVGNSVEFPSYFVGIEGDVKGVLYRFDRNTKVKKIIE